MCGLTVRGVLPTPRRHACLLGSFPELLLALDGRTPTGTPSARGDDPGRRPRCGPHPLCSAWRCRPCHGMHLPANACPSTPEEHRHMTPWQCLTIYRYTLPPPYETTEHLFEALPLSTYPSGTTLKPLAYEMAPGAHLSRAAPWTQALVLFPPREPSGMVGARALGMSFREACARGYLRPYAPQGGLDAGPAALVEKAAAKDAHEKGLTPRACPEAQAS